MTDLSSLIPSLPFLALLAPIALFWSQAKEMMIRVTRLFVVEAQVHRSASEAVLYYLREYGKRLPTNIIKYSSRYEYIKREGREKLMAYEAVRDLRSQWYWLGGNLIMASDKHGLDKEAGIMVDRAVTLRYMRGTVDIERLICDAIKWYEGRDAVGGVRTMPRFSVTRYVGISSSTKSDSPSYAKGNQSLNQDESNHGGYNQALDDWKYSRLLNYSLDEVGYAKRDFFHVFNENARTIQQDVTHWLGAHTWYESKGLLWRRGALLYGPPGSGKSSLIRKVGQSLDLPIVSFELSTMDDQQFIKYWQEIKQRQPCIVVMEDIDTVFNKRAPANANIHLSFECLLNCISGVEPAEGIYLFVTTNRLDQLDEALGIPNERGVSTRPGRLDTCFHMGDISLDEKREIVNHFLSGRPDIGAQLIESSNGCTAAQFSDLCAQKALELYWETKA